MALKIRSLASGSKGNCILVSADNTNILIDAGISFARISSSLSALGLTVSDIDGVLITHEHNDHISGLKKLADYVPLYCHERTFEAIPFKKEIERNLALADLDNGFCIKNVYIMPFRVPHDAQYPLGFCFYRNGIKAAYATDLGHVPDYIVNNLSDCHLLFIESNHDEDMLKFGSYPEALKKRILSKNGHLSNKTAGEVLKRLAGGRLRSVILGHLSLENNRPEKARACAEDALKGMGINIEVAGQYSISEEIFYKHG